MSVDVAAERAVLAGLCQYGNDIYTNVDIFLSDEVFTVPSNRTLYKCLFYLFNKSNVNKIDIPSIFSSAQELGHTEILKDKGEKEYLRSLFNYPIHKENVENFAKKLSKLNLVRKALRENEKVHAELNKLDGSESIYEILSLVESPVFSMMSDLTNDNSDEPVVLGENIDAYLDHIKSNPTDMVGISSGYADYDRYIGGGFRRKAVSVIAARPKTGKTLLADNIGVHVAKNLKIPVLNLDTEMGVDEHRQRIISIMSGVPLTPIGNGKFQFNPRYNLKVEEASREFKKMPYFYKSISGKQLEEILPIIRRWITKEVGYDSSGKVNDCLVIYDYLKLMTYDKLGDHMKEHQMLGFMMTSLHNFVFKYDIPCLAFVQINRDGINKETSDIISQSDRILWLCSNLSIFKKKSEEELIDDGQENGSHKLIPLASRHGPECEEGNYINMYKDDTARITQGFTRFNAAKNQKTSGGFKTDIDDDGPIGF